MNFVCKHQQNTHPQTLVHVTHCMMTKIMHSRVANTIDATTHHALSCCMNVCVCVCVCVSSIRIQNVLFMFNVFQTGFFFVVFYFLIILLFFCSLIFCMFFFLLLSIAIRISNLYRWFNCALMYGLNICLFFFMLYVCLLFRHLFSPRCSKYKLLIKYVCVCCVSFFLFCD